MSYELSVNRELSQYCRNYFDEIRKYFIAIIVFCQRMMHPSPLKLKSFEFSKAVVVLYKNLIDEKREFVMSKQLLKSGTAVGALIRESGNAESALDFIHKMSIAQKECDETLYWLELLYETGFLVKEQFDHLSAKAEEILKMLKSSILTMKKKIEINKANSKKP